MHIGRWGNYGMFHDIFKKEKEENDLGIYIVGSSSCEGVFQLRANDVQFFFPAG
jgi:hypothetical protein